MIKTHPTSLNIDAELAARYRSVRDFSLRLAQSLSPEDCAIQSMTDASPTRWHLAHTTWFFETFVLSELPHYQIFDERLRALFNSYYNAVGEPFPRSRRGQISRPGLAEVLEYRLHVDDAMMHVMEDSGVAPSSQFQAIVEIGLNHEQQHQELILTDIKHAFFVNPLHPSYRTIECCDVPQAPNHSYIQFEDGVYVIGHEGDTFAFDNESPRHRVFLEPFAIANRTVTNREFLEFVEDDGYQRPELWLSLGWNHVQQNNWRHPLYWIHDDGWQEFTLGGPTPLHPELPVTHISYFEADAFARWADARLPTEAEWEVVASMHHANGVFAEDFLERNVPPYAAYTPSDDEMSSLFGGGWEWTSSSYAPYPGYSAPSGALGEYNGKFMCNQYVLRGGSCATPRGHIRSTYRNFFPPETRWQFACVRLARSC